MLPIVPPILKYPLTPQAVTSLAEAVKRIGASALSVQHGEYEGSGVTGNVVPISPVSPLFIYIQERWARAGGEAVFCSVFEPFPVCYIPGSGFVTDAIKAVSRDGLVLGASSFVNVQGRAYSFVIVS